MFFILSAELTKDWSRRRRSTRYRQQTFVNRAEYEDRRTFHFYVTTVGCPQTSNGTSSGVSMPILAMNICGGLIFKNHVYSAEQTDLVLPCSKTYRLDEKFVDTAENQPLKVRSSSAFLCCELRAVTLWRVGCRLYRQYLQFCFQFWTREFWAALDEICLFRILIWSKKFKPEKSHTNARAAALCCPPALC